MTTPATEPRATALDYLLAVIDGLPGARAALIRAGLGLLAGLHWSILQLWRACYALGWARVTRLPAEVISVGNLSMGGTGKTLAVQRLARELAAAGKRVAILSRGHGRRTREERVVLHGAEDGPLTAGEVGDEPALLATSLPGIPVVLGTNRRRTGRRAIEALGADVLILDDGFQYWRLYKDREIVLLDALQPATREHLLPRGVFREPWSHLRRAHEVWITHAQLADAERVALLQRRIARYAPGARMAFTEHQPVRLRSLQGESAPCTLLDGRRILALSGLGNPRQFAMMLAARGSSVIPCVYPDHHQYTDADIQAIAARLEPDMLLVTTAKDAVRLPSSVPFPVWIIEVELALLEAPTAPCGAAVTRPDVPE